MRRFPDRMSSWKAGRILTTSSLVVGARVAGAAFQAGLLALLARWFPISVVGTYAAVYSAWALARHAGPLGFDQAALRFAPTLLEAGDDHRLMAFEGHARRVVAGATALLAVILGAVLLPLALAGNVSIRPGSVLMLCAGLPLFGLHGLYSNQLRGRGSMLGAQAPESIVLPMLGAALLLLGRVLGYESETWALGSAFCSALAVLVIYAVMASRRRPRTESRSMNSFSFSSERRVAFEIWLGQLSIGLSTKLPTILTAATLGSAAAARLEVALRIQSVILLVPTAVSIVASPLFAGAYGRKDLDRLRDLLLGFSWMSFAPSAGLAVGIGVFGPRLLRLFGNSYDSAYLVLLILVVAAALDAGITLASNVFYMTGEQRTVLLSNLFQLTGIVLPFLIFGTGVGLPGIALGILAGSLLRDGFCTVMLPRRLGIPRGLLSPRELQRSIGFARLQFGAP